MIVGLTGGIATGKSTVAAILRDMGVVVLDADEVARDVVAPGSEGLKEIVDVFGSAILTPEGALDRSAMGALVVQNPNARKRLEALTHPRIRAELAQRASDALAAGSEIVFVEAALLVETGSAKFYPALWVVRCSIDRQVERLMARNACDRETAEAWIATQMPVEEKVAHATTVINNDADLESLNDQVESAFHALREPPQGLD